MNSSEKPILIPRRFASLGDPIIVLVVFAIIYAVVGTATQWNSAYHAVTEIDLSPSALPLYTLLSAVRGLFALLLSFVFAISIGYLAAKSKAAEFIIIPMCDILQSIPVLGFLPGLVLALLALFPNTNMGLELAAILMIFINQVWNLVFAFYSSLKSIPTDFNDASLLMNLTKWERMKILELPFSSVNLAWNGVLSLAGGWFFLTVCEAFPLGDLRFRLPGIGAYMSVALETGNTQAVIWGIIAMTSLIIAIDFFFWSPILGWISQFKVEEIPGASNTQPMVLLLVKESWIYNFSKNLLRRRVLNLKKQKRKKSGLGLAGHSKLKIWLQTTLANPRVRLGISILIWIFVFTFLIWGAVGLFKILIKVSRSNWLGLLLKTFFTTVRVFIATALAAAWTIPLGIWVGLSSKRVRIAQPLIQILAAFPTPMIFPLVLAVLFWLGLTINTASIILMMMAAQWYLLFNVLAGALRISKELDENLDLMGLSTIDKWKTLYLPTAFPALVTGLITATGGAWNASIVSEYLSYKSQVLVADGIGSSISIATNGADFPVLAASLTLMVITVLGFNRFIWARVFNYAQTHYRTD